MEHSEIILIALILLIVFAGSQLTKLWELFRVRAKAPIAEPVPVKTVVPAAQSVSAPVAPRKVARKTPAHVKASVKKVPARKKVERSSKSTSAKK